VVRHADSNYSQLQERDLSVRFLIVFISIILSPGLVHHDLLLSLLL